MHLYVVRHAEAAGPSPDGTRPLTSRGRDQAAKLGQWCADRSVRVDAVLHSGILRAEETAQLVATRIQTPAPPAATSGITPDDDPHQAAAWLAAEDRDLLVVSHLPLVEYLTNLLVHGALYGEVVTFRTATLAHLERTFEGGFRLVETHRP